jgi:hypothetical protein
MIEGGWAFIWGAYGVACSGLVVLTLAVTLRLAHWAKRAREERK